jgi:hypothetical protein
MSIEQSNFFYDGQIRRFITQFIRMVSNFEVQFGKNADGQTVLQRVPVIYGDQSRQVAQIITGNSSNVTHRVPAMAVYVSGLQFDRDRVQDPTLIQKMHIRERQFDNVTGTYTQNQGEAYTIERVMPVPYKLTLKLDIWTSNVEQKLQLIEQLSQLFDPAMEIQSTDNYVDWGSLSYALLTDILWSSRSVPTGTEDPIDIATMTFDLPIWISSSAKVKKLGVIQTVISNLDELYNGDFYSDTTSGPFGVFGSRLLTLLEYGVVVNNVSDTYTIKLLKKNGVASYDRYVIVGDNLSWAQLLDQYGRFVSGSSRVRLRQENGSEIVGTIAEHPTDPYSLIYTPFEDTLPANTLDPIDAIIDPTNVDVGSVLQSPDSGTRYLLTQDIGSYENEQGALGWRGSNNLDLVARGGDIVQYNGTYWEVAFDSQQENALQYVTNLVTGIQYKWINNEWIKSFEGMYEGGQWSLAL